SLYDEDKDGHLSQDELTSMMETLSKLADIHKRLIKSYSTLLTLGNVPQSANAYVHAGENLSSIFPIDPPTRAELAASPVVAFDEHLDPNLKHNLRQNQATTEHSVNVDNNIID